MSSKNEIRPRHIVIFPDGNRRWAKKNKLPSLRGHLKGKEKFDKLLFWCKDRGVEVVTVFGFSSENWNRSKKEVNYLMDLFEKNLSDKKMIARFQEGGVRVKIIGQKERLRPSLQKIITNIENITKNNNEIYLNLAVSYGGKWDILQSVQKLIKEGIRAEDLTEDMIAQHLTTAGFPEPDLVIRAGGEKRLSNFVLWQAAYTELYFSDKYWPDFNEEDLDLAFEEYANRQRRFGK